MNLITDAQKEYKNVIFDVSKTESEILSLGANSIIKGQMWIASDTKRILFRELDGSFSYPKANIGNDVPTDGKYYTRRNGSWVDITSVVEDSHSHSNLSILNGTTASFTIEEETKLAGLEESKFLGTYADLASLESAHPTASAGSYAYVDSGVGSDTQLYIWDTNDSSWIIGGGTGTETPATIKAKYESNSNTNAFTDGDKSKLDSVEEGAQKNITGELNSINLQGLINSGVTDIVISEGQTIPNGTYTFKRGATASESIQYQFRGAEFKLATTPNVQFVVEAGTGGLPSVDFHTNVVEPRNGSFNISTEFEVVTFWENYFCQSEGTHTITMPTTTRFSKFEIEYTENSATNVVFTNDFVSISQWHTKLEDDNVVVSIAGSPVVSYDDHQKFFHTPQGSNRITDIIAGDNVTVTRPDGNTAIISSADPTTAGTLTTVFLTGDSVTTPEGTFYTSNITKGVTASVEQSVTVNDDQTDWFAQDVLGGVTVDGGDLVSGNYSGQLSVEVNSNAGNQEFFVELYKTDINGAVIDGGVVSEPIGDLGVRPFARGSTGVFDIVSDNPSNVPFTAVLTENVELLPSERVLYHIGAKKVGISGGVVTMYLRYGTSWNSYINTPVAITLQSVTETGNETNIEMVLDVEGKGESDRVFTVKNNTTTLGSIRGDGLVLFLKATIGELATGFMTVGTKWWNRGKSFFGNIDTDYNAVLNVTSPTESGYQFTTGQSRPVDGFYTDAGSHNGQPYYTFGSYFLFYGTITSVGGKWFIGTTLDSGDDAFANALYVQDSVQIEPEGDEFTGQNSESGHGGSASPQTSSDIGISTDTFEVRNSAEIKTLTVDGDAITGTNTGDQDLSNLVPYSGATQDVNLNSKKINNVSRLLVGSITQVGGRIVNKQQLDTFDEGISTVGIETSSLRLWVDGLTRKINAGVTTIVEFEGGGDIRLPLMTQALYDAEPSTSKIVPTKEILEAKVSGLVPYSGATQAVDLNNNLITNVWTITATGTSQGLYDAQPSHSKIVPTKEILESGLSGRVPYSGATSDVDLNGKKLTNVASGVASSDVATVGQITTSEGVSGIVNVSNGTGGWSASNISVVGEAFHVNRHVYGIVDSALAWKLQYGTGVEAVTLTVSVEEFTGKKSHLILETPEDGEIRLKMGGAPVMQLLNSGGENVPILPNIDISDIENATGKVVVTREYVENGLSSKVDKVTGKGLSTEDYTTAEKNKLGLITGTNTGDQDLSGLVPYSGATQDVNFNQKSIRGLADVDLQKFRAYSESSSDRAILFGATNDSSVAASRPYAYLIKQASTRSVSYQDLEFSCLVRGVGEAIIARMSYIYGFQVYSRLGGTALSVSPTTGTVALSLMTQALYDAEPSTSKIVPTKEILEAKVSGLVPYSGAVQNVNLNSKKIINVSKLLVGSTTQVGGRIVNKQQLDTFDEGISTVGIETSSLRLWVDGLTRKINAGVTTIVEFEGGGDIRLPLMTQALYDAEPSTSKIVPTKEILENGLSNLVPYSGATSDVDLNGKNLTCGNVVARDSTKEGVLQVGTSVDNIGQYVPYGTIEFYNGDTSTGGAGVGAKISTKTSTQYSEGGDVVVSSRLRTEDDFTDKLFISTTGKTYLPAMTQALYDSQASTSKIVPTKEILENELSGFVPYSGATQAVDLNNNLITNVWTITATGTSQALYNAQASYSKIVPTKEILENGLSGLLSKSFDGTFSDFDDHALFQKVTKLSNYICASGVSNTPPYTSTTWTMHVRSIIGSDGITYHDQEAIAGSGVKFIRPVRTSVDGTNVTYYEWDRVVQDKFYPPTDNNYTNADKAKVNATSGTNTGDQDLSSFATTAYVDSLVSELFQFDLTYDDMAVGELTTVTGGVGSSDSSKVAGVCVGTLVSQHSGKVSIKVMNRTGSQINLVKGIRLYAGNGALYAVAQILSPSIHVAPDRTKVYLGFITSASGTLANNATTTVECMLDISTP